MVGQVNKWNSGTEEEVKDSFNRFLSHWRGTVEGKMGEGNCNGHRG